MPAKSRANPAEFRVFRGDRVARTGIRLPPAPPWRCFDQAAHANRGAEHIVTPEQAEVINAALCLRRPLLVTGRPGTGKSSLAYAIAHELGLGEVLVWPVTSRSTLAQGMYHYDAIARLQEAALHERARRKGRSGVTPEIGRFLRLGPLGTALIDSGRDRPRVLLIDELDKSDIDLPNDLLHVFEEGEYEIAELARLPKGRANDAVAVPLHKETRTADIPRGRVRCQAFPVVVLTSNGEREFPPAFLRRCLRLDIQRPSREQLEAIVRARLHLDSQADPRAAELIQFFEDLRDKERQELATDQLLNAVHLVCTAGAPFDKVKLREVVLRALSDTPS